MMAAQQPKKILMLGGTRFIGVYLARMLVDEGHEVTLLTRGKSPVTTQIPDDTDEYYAEYAKAINHIACDRKDADAVAGKLKELGLDTDLGALLLYLDDESAELFELPDWWKRRGAKLLKALGG